MSLDFEIIITLATMALWLLFPIGIFFSVGYLDRTTEGHDQHVSLENKLDSKPREGFHFPHWLHWGMRH